MSRFSQAISEGDGISVIPVLDGDVAALADQAAAAGAEAVAVRTAEEVQPARSGHDLPVLLLKRIRSPEELHEARRVGASACLLVYEVLTEDDLLEELATEAQELGIDCALDVRDEEELAEALERVDPEIIVLSERDRDDDEDDLSLTLDLLPDVPAGKLVISEARIVAREQVLALERAGVDAVLVSDSARGSDFRGALEELVGGPRHGG